MPTNRSSQGRPAASPLPKSAVEPTGKLILSGLTAYGYHGNNPPERKLGQTFTADIEVHLDTRSAAASDRLAETLSYPVVERIARQILEGKPVKLLETVAERIASEILKQPKVSRVTVRVTKRPPIAHLAAFSVEITRPLESEKPPKLPQ